ncbi:glycosyltransferase family 4 protein, partial [Candidatus Sumerlaeota bacterium]|nr:glycosyltransferase family 4 protein [Candidatus Sumerlaeota bacterium]
GRRGRLGRIVWEQTRLTGLIAREKPDVFHAPAFVLPGRLSVPTVATIHDLVFMRYPETFGYFRRNYFQWAIPRSAYRATRIIADSEATRRDLVDLLQVRPERISVVPLGVGSEFFEPASAEAKQQLRSLLHLPTPRLKPGANPEGYVLTVGTIEPRKNLVRLVEAYEIVRRRLGRRCPALVLVGRKGWMWGEVFERIEQRGLAGDVIWSDFLSDDLVRAAYQGAALFVCLSLHEGFGLPLLEAMASGVAVIASGRSSMPEVVGEAGVLVDPGDVRAVAEAMADLLSDEDKRSGFAAKARERARTFSWQLTAQRTLAIYEEVGARNLTGFTGLTG